jgi:hypothetical protein
LGLRIWDGIISGIKNSEFPANFKNMEGSLKKRTAPELAGAVKI